MIPAEHGQEGVQSVGATVPEASGRGSVPRVNQRVRLALVASGGDEEGDAVDQRGGHAHGDLGQEHVVVLHLSGAEGVEVAIGPDEALQLGSAGGDIYSLSSPAEDQPELVILRRDDRADLPDSPLAVVVRGAEHVARQLVVELLQERVEHLILV